MLSDIGTKGDLYFYGTFLYFLIFFQNQVNGGIPWDTILTDTLSGAAAAGCHIDGHFVLGGRLGYVILTDTLSGAAALGCHIDGRSAWGGRLGYICM